VLRRWIRLLSFGLTVGIVCTLYGLTATLPLLLAAALRWLILKASLPDSAATHSDSQEQLIRQERHREALKKFWAEKLRKTPEIARLMTAHRAGEADLDDYLELISCGWPVEERLQVMQDPNVFAYFLTHPEQSKWEILTTLQEIYRSRRTTAEPPRELRKQNTR